MLRAVTPTPNASKTPPKQTPAALVVVIFVALMYGLVKISGGRAEEKREQAQTEAAARDAADRPRREAEQAARRAEELRDCQEALVAFRLTIIKADPTHKFTRDAAIVDGYPTKLQVFVAPNFDALPKRSRLDMLSVYEQAWAKVNPKHCEKGCRLELINAAGRNVGSWGPFMGAEVEGD